MRQIPPLRNGNVRCAPSSAAASSPEVRLVTDQRDAAPLDAFGQLGQQTPATS